MLKSVAAVTPTRSSVHWLPEEFLLAQGVQQWMELPLWLAGHDQNGLCERARAAGLTLRSLEETARDTRAWDLTRERAAPLKAGLSADKERAVLKAAGH